MLMNMPLLHGPFPSVMFSFKSAFHHYCSSKSSGVSHSLTPFNS